MSPLTFDSAKPEDLDLLFQLNKSLIDAFEDLESIDYPRVLAWVRQNLQNHLSDFTRVYYENTLAAFYCLSPSEGKLELDSLFVLPEFRGQGIGTAILKKCISESETPLFLYVFRKNTGACALYRRMGFTVTKELPTRYIMEYQKQGC